MAYSAPTSKTTGTLITAAIWNQDVVDNENAAFPLGVDAWTAYTPTLTQSATVTKTVDRATYQRVGRMITAQFSLTVTGAGTAANGVRIGIPVAAVATAIACGAAWVYDTSATTRYACVAEIDATTSTLSLLHDTSGASVFGVAPAVTLAAGDLIRGTVTYEALS